MFGIRKGFAALGAVSLIAVGGVVATASSASAWEVGATASADCSSKGTVVINGSFTNHEHNADGDMNVTMKLGSKSDGPSRVNHQQMGLFTIDTGESSVPAGSVTFLETWVNRSGSDQKTATFSAKSCSQPQPESKKVFVCKYVGTPGVNERRQTGNNPISVSWKQGDRVPGQWFNDAQNRSYVLAWDTGQPKPDVSLCPAPEGPPPVTKVNVPASPATVDACNPAGVTDNVAWKNPLPADTDQVNWSESSNGNKRTASLKGENVEWSDGTTAPKVFTLPDDSGVKCDVPVIKVKPVAPSYDVVCGPDNDKVGYSSQPEGVTLISDSGWTSGTRTLTYGANEGYVLDGTGVFTLHDESTVCPPVTSALCTSFSGFPSGSTYTVIAIYTGEEFLIKGPYSTDNPQVIDIPTEGLYGFTITVNAANGDVLFTSDTYTSVPKDCLVIKPPTTPPTKVTVPTVPVVDECGVGNAHYGDVPTGNYTVVRNEDGSITLTAKDGYVFPDGKKSVTLPKPEETNTKACPVIAPKASLTSECEILDGAKSGYTVVNAVLNNKGSNEEVVFEVAETIDGMTNIYPIPVAAGEELTPQVFYSQEDGKKVSLVINARDAALANLSFETATCAATVTPPPPPPTKTCPAGTKWVDLNHNGKVDSGECKTPSKPKPPVKPPFKCPSGMTGSDLNHNGKVDSGECKTPVKKPAKRGIGANTGLDDVATPASLFSGGNMGIALAILLMGGLVLEVTRRRTRPGIVDVSGRQRKG